MLRGSGEFCLVAAMAPVVQVGGGEEGWWPPLISDLRFSFLFQLYFLLGEIIGLNGGETGQKCRDWASGG